MVVNSTNKKFLKIIYEANAVIEGHFIYTNNYHSGIFIDTDLIFQYPYYVEMIIVDLYQFFKDQKVDYIISPNYRSGAILAHNLGEKFNSKVMIIRRERGFVDTTSVENIKGNVLIVDDGINTGNTVTQILRITRNQDVKIVGMGFFINRYINDLGKDFRNIQVESILSLNEPRYKLVEKEKCNLCKEYRKIKEELKNRDMNDNMRKTLLGKKNKLKIKPAYGDIY